MDFCIRGRRRDVDNKELLSACPSFGGELNILSVI